MTLQTHVRDLTTGPVRRPARRIPRVPLVRPSQRGSWPHLAVPRRALGPTLDLIAAVASVAAVSRLGGELPGVLAVAVPLMWAPVLAISHGYEHPRTAGGPAQVAARVCRASVVLTIACLCVAALTGIQPHPGPVLVVAALAAAGSLVPRAAADLWHRARPGTTPRIPVVVAGYHQREVTRLVSELRRDPTSPFEVAMVCLPRRPRSPAYDVPIAVGLDRLPERVAAVGAQALIVLPCHHVDGDAVRRLGWRLEASRTTLYVGTHLTDVALSRTCLAVAGDLRMLHVRTRRHRGPARAVKTGVEWLGAAVLLVVLAPLLITLCCAVRLDSPGPVVYRQTRVGREGTCFTMYKLRTMVAEADRDVASLTELDDGAGVLFKIRQDPRVTRVGRFLRRYSLDELPQLVNVLRGDMSLIGPRPALPEEVAAYEPDALRRLAVKPGLTGLWQVSGRSDLSWEDTLRMDLRYVDNWSLGLDLLIAARTFPAVFAHRGAY